eukprot:COSAG06_NODE_54811_length_292_cov_2.207254_1_plen_26_part_10
MAGGVVFGAKWGSLSWQTNRVLVRIL